MDKRPPTREELCQVLMLSYVLFALEIGGALVFFFVRAPMLGWVPLLVVACLSAKMHHGAKGQLNAMDEK